MVHVLDSTKHVILGYNKVHQFSSILFAHYLRGIQKVVWLHWGARRFIP